MINSYLLPSTLTRCLVSWFLPSSSSSCISFYLIPKSIFLLLLNLHSIFDFCVCASSFSFLLLRMSLLLVVVVVMMIFLFLCALQYNIITHSFLRNLLCLGSVSLWPAWHSIASSLTFFSCLLLLPSCLAFHLNSSYFSCVRIDLSLISWCEE